MAICARATWPVFRNGRIEQEVRLLSGAVRRHIVGGLEINRIDFGQLDELQDLHVTKGARCDAPEFVIAHEHILLGLILVSFEKFGTRNRLGIFGRSGRVAHRSHERL